MKYNKNTAADLAVIADETKIFFLEGADRFSILKELFSKLKDKSAFTNRQVVEKELFEREALMSTGIGCGIAFPHVRSKNVLKFQAVLGIIPRGTAWETFDRLPVQIVVLLTVPENQHEEYLGFLSCLGAVLKDEKKRKQIISSCTEQEVVKIIRPF